MIVTYNSNERLAACVDSLRAHLDIGPGKDELILVDNRSTASLTDVDMEDGVIAVSNLANLGYGGACNVGAKLASSEVLFLLNPDTRLRTSLEPAIRILEGDPGCAIVSPKIVTDDGDWYETLGPFPSALSDALTETSLNRWLARRRWTEATRTQALGRRAIDGFFSSGSALLVRRSAFEDVGGFDDHFFLYYEEADLFKRLSDRGFHSVFEPGVTVQHSGGGSSASLGWKRTASRHVSKARYFAKHADRGDLLLHRALTVVILMAKVVLQGVRGRRGHVRAHLFGLGLYLSAGIRDRVWRRAVLSLGHAGLSEQSEAKARRSWRGAPPDLRPPVDGGDAIADDSGGGGPGSRREGRRQSQARTRRASSE